MGSFRPVAGNLHLHRYYNFTESLVETVPDGRFDWGGRLLKCNGGAQRFPQNGWKSFVECKGRRELDCETYKSSRDESRA